MPKIRIALYPVVFALITGIVLLALLVKDKELEITPTNTLEKEGVEGYIVVYQPQPETGEHRYLIIEDRHREWVDDRPNAEWLVVNERTKVTDSKGKELQASALHVGLYVKTWNTGIKDFSFPSQGVATRFELQVDPVIHKDSNISKALAIEIALNDMQDENTIYFVKDATFNEESLMWEIDLAVYDNPNESVRVTVNSITGEDEINRGQE